MLEIKIEGVESLAKEFTDEFMPRVDKAITAGLKAVANDMTASLREHIQTDVYDAYTPDDYVRRGKHVGGMLDEDNFPDVESAVKGNTLTYFYSFKPKPSSWYSGRDDYEEYADGDDSIRAIQTGKGYPTVGDLYENGELVKRPFWTNFVTDYFGGGNADISLANGMNSADSRLGVTSDKQKVQVDVSDLAHEPSGSKVIYR